MIENLPANAGNTGSIPGPGRFYPWSWKVLPAAEQLSPCPQLLSPGAPEPVLHDKESHYSEKPVHRDEVTPSLTTARESPRAPTKAQHSQNSVIKKHFKNHI